MNTIDIKREKIATYAKWGGAAVVCFLVSPVIFLVLKGAAGLALAGLFGLLAVNAAPWLSMKFANWKVKAIKHEAMQNPIETLENLLIEKRLAFNKAREMVTEGVAAKNTFATKIKDFAKRYPARAPEFEQQLVAMENLIAQKKAALDQAQDAINAAEHKLEEMRAYWEMSQAAQAANKAVRMDTGDLYAKMKEDTAVDSVYASMNKAFAELEVASALDVNEPLRTNKDLTPDDVLRSSGAVESVTKSARAA